MLVPKSPDGHSAWDYAQSAIDLLWNIQLAIQDGKGLDPLPRRIPWNIPCDGTGFGQVELPIARGKKWDLSGIAFWASTQGYVATYVNGEDPSGFIKVNTSALLVSDEFNDSDVVTGQDAKLVIVARGQAANQVVSGNISLLQFDEMEPKNTDQQ